MSKKPETVFRAKLRKRLDSIPNSWWESIQQQGICGTPDILGCVGKLFVAIEVKTDHGVVSMIQKHKLDKITKTGSFALVVTPKSMEADLNRIMQLTKETV